MLCDRFIEYVEHITRCIRYPYSKRQFFFHKVEVIYVYCGQDNGTHRSYLFFVDWYFLSGSFFILLFG